MKKLIALLLALAMVFSLAACGGSSSEEKPAEPPKAPADPNAVRELYVEFKV